MEYTQKLIDFANEITDEIRMSYEQSGDDPDNFDGNMLEYLLEWGEVNQMTEDQVINEFNWTELTMELGLD